jgi:hypothetical protein
MSWFAAFALFGVPLSLLALGWAAVMLQERGDRPIRAVGVMDRRSRTPLR